MSSKLIDRIIIFRILKKLTTPWKKTDAFKLGVIDDEGELLVTKKERTREQENAYTVLDRLVFNLKRLIQKAPGGKSQLGSYLAALALIKEHVQQEANEETVKILIEKLETYKLVPLLEHDLSTQDGFLDAFEEAMVSGASIGGALSGSNTNASANATGLAGVDNNLFKKKRKEKTKM